MNSNEIKNLMRDLQDLHNRLVANYNDNVPFEQLEEDRLIVSDTLDLINQYEAEIVRLKQIVGFTPARHSGKSPFLNMVLDNVRAEAIKEFAERLKEKAIYMPIWNGMFKSKMVGTRVIKDLLKEMGVE